MRNKQLLQTILDTIEEHIEEPLSIDTLAGLCFVSEVYIRKLFTTLFHMPISSYIRKRKLSLSAQVLQSSDARILDVALQFGFQHEQSYIHAFKQEFQMTPYQWKKAKLPLMITEKLSLAHIQEMADGNLMMPSFVLLPDMQFAGRKHTMGFVQSHTEAPMHALQFWQEEQHLINDGVEPGVYYGITMNYQKEKQISDYYPSAHVKKSQPLYENVCLPATRYARFTYIGNHPYDQISIATASDLYQRIDLFFQSEVCRQYTFSRHTYFERIDTNVCDEDFCVMEWYIPIEE